MSLLKKIESWYVVRGGFRLSGRVFKTVGVYQGGSWMGARLGSWPGRQPEGISVESVLRGLGAGVSVLRKRFLFEIFVLRLIGSWKGMLAVLRGIARPGGRPGGIIVKASRIDFAREPGKPENFKNKFEFFERWFSDVAEELRFGKIEW